MSLLGLPNELLYVIGKDSDLSTSDLSSFCQTNRYLKCLLSPLLISRNANDVLVFSAQRGFVDQAREAFAVGARVDADDWEYGCPALHWAAMGGHESVVKLMLDYGADIATKIDNGWTALHWAVVAGYRHRDHLYSARRISRAASWRGRARTGVETAGRFAATALYIESDSEDEADDNIERCKFPSAPYTTRHQGHQAVARLLLENKADINAKALDGKTALCLAVEYGHVASVELLLEQGGDIRLGSVSRLRSLTAGTREETIFRLLMERNNRDDTMKIPDTELGNAFLKAASSGNAGALKFLLLCGVAATTSDEQNYESALHIAAAEGHCNIVGILLDEGLDVDTTDSEGCTALHRAKCLELVTLVLERGANIEARDFTNQTPLHAMARLDSEPAATRCVSLLLSRGADTQVQDLYGRTPLHRAVISSTPEVVTLLLKHNPNTAVEDDNRLTPLHWAAMARRLEIVRILVAAGADITVRSRNRRTLLHEIIHLSAVEMEGCYQGESLWSDHGSVGTYRRDGELFVDGQRRWEPMIKLLLDLGVDAFAVDDTGYPPYKAARAIHWRRMSEILTKYRSPKVRLCLVKNTKRET